MIPGVAKPFDDLSTKQGFSRAALVACAGAALLLSACSRSSSVTYSGETMGTTYTIKVCRLPKNVDADQLGVEIDQRLSEISRLMSNYQADSELSRLNDFNDGGWFPVSMEMVFVLERAREVSDATDGAFDVTVGPILRLWNFGPGREGVDRIPSDAEIEAAKQQVGFEKIDLRREPSEVRKQQADLEIDLSAVAKGFAVDEIEDLLLSHAVVDYMVEIGGEVQTGGLNDRGEPWNIAIEAPIAEIRQIHRVVPLTKMGMATSGDYRNFFEIEGQRYSHIIDPRTGRPVSHNLVSVTVLHPSCAIADAWATALLVLGPDEGFQVADGQQLAVLFIMRTEDGFEEKRTPRFDEAVQQMTDTSEE
jgi:thiamine biosynthesis lipoprotein